MKEIMTVDHPRWNEFINRLEGLEGCNFRKDGDNFTWRCDSTMERSLAKTILKRMSIDIDIEGSLEYFAQHGGYCDCEIIFNVGSEFHCENIPS